MQEKVGELLGNAGVPKASVVSRASAATAALGGSAGLRTIFEADAATEPWRRLERGADEEVQTCFEIRDVEYETEEG